ncbi:MAG TPA: hypothetical protein PLQ76_09120 [bacterium]|nr:hypothetical protein [bacterium]
MTEREEDILRASTFLKAALPLLEEVVEADAGLKKMVAKWNCSVQFQAKKEEPAAYLKFEGGSLKVLPGKCEKPTIAFTFKNLKDMNAFFTGKNVLFGISGLIHVLLLMKVVKILLKLKMLMPAYVCKNDDEKALKVKLLMYMVAFALQEMSHGGDEYILRLTQTARKKIVEWTVKPDGPAVWVKMDEGKIVATKGRTDRRPYVAMDFVSIDAALKLLTSEVGAIDAARQQLVSFRGTSEYGIKVGNLMTRVSNFLMPEA